MLSDVLLASFAHLPSMSVTFSPNNFYWKTPPLILVVKIWQPARLLKTIMTVIDKTQLYYHTLLLQAFCKIRNDILAENHSVAKFISSYGEGCNKNSYALGVQDVGKINMLIFE